MVAPVLVILLVVGLETGTLPIIGTELGVKGTFVASGGSSGLVQCIVTLHERGSEKSRKRVKESVIEVFSTCKLFRCAAVQLS